MAEVWPIYNVSVTVVRTPPNWRVIIFRAGRVVYDVMHSERPSDEDLDVLMDSFERAEVSHGRGRRHLWTVR